jgi:protein-cysteine N-palmitoyltransferase HHAT
MLRMVSYTMDHYWKLNSGSGPTFLTDSNLSERERIETSLETEDDYGFLSYLAYMLYAPLYMAGPIITYNNFIHQVWAS